MNYGRGISLLFGFLFLLLNIRFILYHLYHHNISKYTNGQQVKFTTTLFTEPYIVGRFQRISVNGEGGGRIFITIPQYPQFHYGDSVRVTGPVKAMRLHGASSLKEKVLAREKLVWTMQFPKVEAIKKQENILLAVTQRIRQRVVALFEKTLPPRSSALLLGIVFGIKQNTDKDFNNKLRIAGVLHVIAASGMNVTLVGGFLSSFFMIFFKRQVALIASILGIIFYAFLAGLEPSIIRASIMGIMVFSSQIVGRQTLAIYTLLLAGFLMLFISPPIISDVGFQLSFLSTLGILYIKPLIDKPFYIISTTRKLLESDVTTTLAAQLATLPILLSNFGQYSFFSIVVNGLVLWTIPTMMILGGLGGIAGFVFEPLGQLFLYLCLPFIWYFEKIVSLFGSSGVAISISEFPLPFMIGYYCLLASLIVFLSKKRA